MFKSLFKGWEISLSATLLLLSGVNQGWLVVSTGGVASVNWCLAQQFSLPDEGGDEGAWMGQCRRLAVALKTHWFFPAAAAISHLLQEGHEAAHLETQRTGMLCRAPAWLCVAAEQFLTFWFDLLEVKLAETVCWDFFFNLERPERSWKRGWWQWWGVSPVDFEGSGK